MKNEWVERRVRGGKGYRRGMYSLCLVVTFTKLPMPLMRSPIVSIRHPIPLRMLLMVEHFTVCTPNISQQNEINISDNLLYIAEQ